jgi:Protein of unknown function (DUF1329)
MKRLTTIVALILICMLGGGSTLFAGNDSSAPMDGATVPIPPGTMITMANWTQYRDFMPDGMVGLFEGKYFWKMPPDIRIEVAPTEIHPLPKNYLAATEKHASQLQIIELPGGGLTLNGYMGGIPFPNPQEPHKGWKVLADLWFRYV